jgi:putative tricarboxylic transport membrane protein
MRDRSPHHVRAPQDLAAGASLVALAFLALWASADLPAGRLRAIGPGMLPRALAIALGAVGVVLVVKSLVRAGASVGRWSLRGPFLVCLGAVAFALTIRTFGLVVAGPLVAMIAGAASPDARPRELLVFAIVVTAFCVALFRYALHLPIPILVVPGVVTI